MAITAAMSSDRGEQHRGDGKLADDGHEHDLVMPGFRFHPTEEEIIEFYLRRKVEGKRFNVELITFLDLYRYDPWELPALAAIGEKEWFFYVPRDRKYRNGDRPNRVTTSGYWKATGADRMIRSENSTPIGLKKTLVFYSGKAPKGIRSSWIMNEYRLPHSETKQYQQEISLCRVYKRPCIEDHCHLPGTLSSRPSSSMAPDQNRHNSSPSFGTLALDSPSPDVDKTHEPTIEMPSVVYTAPTVNQVASLSSAMEAEVAPIATCTTINELDKIIGYSNQGSYLNHPPEAQILSMAPPLQPQLLPLNVMPNSLPAISDELWELSSFPAEAAGRGYTTGTDHFK